MKQNIDPHIFTGMQRDRSISKHDGQFLYDAHNIRFTPMNGDTMLSITNEKGPMNIGTIEGNYVGHCVLNNYVVIFTTSNAYDRIYVINESEEYTLIYKGQLNLSVNNPIEALGVYENDLVQKVYWTDGNNQPRVINISMVKTPEWNGEGIDTQFDFIPTLKLNEQIQVVREEGAGVFSPGVIQYAFTYYKLYGQETNIFYTTPLYNISLIDRGGKEGETISNTFTIIIDNVDSENFDYIRIYSIQRTSYNTTPAVKRVVDLDLKVISGNTIMYKDAGNTGDIIDPRELLYKGGESIIAQTMTSKDNTLFLGNLRMNRTPIPNEIKDVISPTVDISNSSFNISNKVHLETDIDSVFIDGINESPFYGYKDTLKYVKPSFKQREHYRLGLQFQHTTGKWSEPVWIGDYTIKNIKGREQEAKWIVPDYKQDSENNKTQVDRIIVTCKLDTTAQDVQKLREANYIKVRPVVVLPGLQDRLVLTQGMLCPTVYNTFYRKNSTPFAQSSWFLRPTLQDNVDSVSNSGTNVQLGAWVEFRHNHLLKGYNTKPYDRGSEISSAAGGDIWVSRTAYDSPEYAVDQSILNMYSPEIEWDPAFSHIDYSDWKLRLVGLCNFTSSIGNIDIQTSTPAGCGDGFVKKDLGVQLTKSQDSKQAFRSLVSGLFWHDGKLDIQTPESGESSEYNIHGNFSYLIYPWQRSGSLNDDVNRPVDKGTRTAVLKTKKIANLKFSGFNNWFKYYDIQDSTFDYNITPVQLFDSEDLQLMKIPYGDYSVSVGNINYYGNVDTMVNPKKSISIPYAGGKIFEADITESSYADNNGINGSVRINYKSGKHLVFSLLAQQNHQPNILPSLDNKNRVPLVYDIPYWLTDSIKESKESIYVEEDYTTITNRVTNPLASGISAAVGVFTSNLNSYTVGSYYYVYDNTNFQSRNEPNKDLGRIYLVTEELIYDVGNDDNYQVVAKPIEEANIKFRINFNDGSQDFYVKTVGNSNGEVIFDEVTPVDPSQPQFAVNQRDITLTDILYSEDKQRTGWYIDDYDTTSVTKHPYSFLYLAELYRDPDVTDFGGITDDALIRNTWIPAGEPQNLPLVTDQDCNIYINFDQGDTWYQRYDFLKTLPFTDQSENQITEIGSFMCETRINIDGRSDRNRGLIDNLNVNKLNFNLLNNVYSQYNNFFNYSILTDQYYELNNFPCQVTWTKENAAGAMVDNWTNVTLASILDMDGVKGKITSLNTFNDNIFCFQDQAVSNILFNSRVQIPTSDGIPVEIANSYKVDGKRYILDGVGCNNKQSVCVTPSGIYFIDSIGGGLYNIGGEQTSDVSLNHGFSNWFKTMNGVAEKTFYDKINNDIYLIYPDTSLVFSEKLGQFTSFMSYENVPAMFNIGNTFYCVKDNSSNCDIYSMFNGEYNEFFGQYQPFDLTFISNPDSVSDKIFTNLDVGVNFYKVNITTYRTTFEDNVIKYCYIMFSDEEENAYNIVDSKTLLGVSDVHESQVILNEEDKTASVSISSTTLVHPNISYPSYFQEQHTKFFDYIEVGDEASNYQYTGKVPLTFLNVKPSNLKKKFRIWHTNIPRNKIGVSAGKQGMQRIRDTWTKIKLGMNNTQSSLDGINMELHGLNVTYYS